MNDETTFGSICCASAEGRECSVPTACCIEEDALAAAAVGKPAGLNALIICGPKVELKTEPTTATPRVPPSSRVTLFTAEPPPI